VNPAESWADKVERAATNPARIERRKRLLQQRCGAECGCKQEDALTTNITTEEQE